MGCVHRTWHVPADVPTIQAGIDASASGDTILVACDTYYEYNLGLKSGVCLRSEAGDPECVTIDAAYFIRMEDKVGSIEVGKYADLVVLEKNLFEVEPEAISDVQVVSTMMNGKFTYQAADDSTKGEP